MTRSSTRLIDILHSIRWSQALPSPAEPRRRGPRRGSAVTEGLLVSPRATQSYKHSTYSSQRHVRRPEPRTVLLPSKVLVSELGNGWVQRSNRTRRAVTSQKPPQREGNPELAIHLECLVAVTPPPQVGTLPGLSTAPSPRAGPIRLQVSLRLLVSVLLSEGRCRSLWASPSQPRLLPQPPEDGQGAGLQTTASPSL